ncbi:hypothetical protein ACLIYM_19550 [Streptomyces fenghuangensis]
MSGAGTGAEEEAEYVSVRCAIGVHGECADAEPGESGAPGVRHLACACSCHPGREGRAVPEPAPPPGEEGWYRLCWVARPDGELDRLFPSVSYGVLIGRDVPVMLRGMRGCLAPSVFHDPARVRERADTGQGWSYEDGNLAVHAHRIAEPAGPQPLFGGTGWKGAGR